MSDKREPGELTAADLDWIAERHVGAVDTASRLRELASQEATLHGYECDDRDRQRAIDLAVMVTEQALKEFLGTWMAQVEDVCDAEAVLKTRNWRELVSYPFRALHYLMLEWGLDPASADGNRRKP